MSKYTLVHIEGYSRADHFGPEIINRVQANAGRCTFDTLAEARREAKRAIGELPDSARAAGLPRIEVHNTTRDTWHDV
jgi:hypothetical protein